MQVVSVVVVSPGPMSPGERLSMYWSGCVELALLGAELGLDTTDRFAGMVHRELSRVYPDLPSDARQKITDRMRYCVELARRLHSL